MGYDPGHLRAACWHVGTDLLERKRSRARENLQCLKPAPEPLYRVEPLSPVMSAETARRHLDPFRSFGRNTTDRSGRIDARRRGFVG